MALGNRCSLVAGDSYGMIGRRLAGSGGLVEIRGVDVAWRRADLGQKIAPPGRRGGEDKACQRDRPVIIYLNRNVIRPLERS